ncbi:MAG: hypothetical protein H7067_13765 [Burkholderiales bacterium]|nr:hypothetical protein [Opitutaceae bacterium]
MRLHSLARLALGLLAFAALAAPALPRLGAAEVQAHGLVFEHWVCDTFFGAYRPPGYTQKWDIPAEANHLADPALAGLPANPKATKHGAPVGLGDALRQYDVDEPFLLILGYWEQPTPEEKRFVKLLAPRVDPAVWRKLWGPVTRADLERLDALIKDRSLPPAEVRLRAQEMKKQPPFSEAVFVLNPKIDSKGQRRLQCSLRQADVFKYLAPETSPEPETTPTLWGVPFPGPVASAPRSFDDEP